MLEWGRLAGDVGMCRGWFGMFWGKLFLGLLERTKCWECWDRLCYEGYLSFS